MIKSTGMVRKVDELGRIVIPIEIRNKLDIMEKDELEVSVQGRRIVLEKYQQDCIICGETNNLKQCSNKFICERCISQIEN